MRSRLIFLALPALVLLALLASGCGGGGSSSTTTAKKPKVEEKPQLSKADFITQGDGVCGEVNTAIGSVAESAAESTSQTTQTANLYIGMVESLQRLGRPSPATGYSEFMGAAEKLAKVEGEIKKAAEAEDIATLETASQEAVPAVEEFQSEAAVYGFEDCSEGPHAPEAAPETSAGTEEAAPEESGGIEVAPEEEWPRKKNSSPKKKSPRKKKWPPKRAAPAAKSKKSPRKKKPEPNPAASARVIKSPCVSLATPGCRQMSTRAAGQAAFSSQAPYNFA